MPPLPLHGVLPVFQTPYRDDGGEAIDFATLEREIDWLFESGADGIAQAMVSEILRLSGEERRELAEAAIRFAKGRGSTIISVGGESAKIAVEFAKHAESRGATATMAAPPIHVACDEDELRRYYERILNATTIPLIIQDASGYVGRPLSMAFYAKIHGEFGERLYYKPEAAPIGPRLSTLRDITHRQARIIEGSGGSALVDSHHRGIVGAMPGAEIIFAIVALWQALERGDRERAYRISLPVSALVGLQQGLDGYLAVEKYLLVKQGVFSNAHVRGPVGFRLDEETRQEVDRLFAMIQCAVNDGAGPVS